MSVMLMYAASVMLMLTVKLVICLSCVCSNCHAGALTVMLVYAASVMLVLHYCRLCLCLLPLSCMLLLRLSCWCCLCHVTGPPTIMLMFTADAYCLCHALTVMLVFAASVMLLVLRLSCQCPICTPLATLAESKLRLGLSVVCPAVWLSDWLSGCQSLGVQGWGCQLSVLVHLQAQQPNTEINIVTQTPTASYGWEMVSFVAASLPQNCEL